MKTISIVIPVYNAEKYIGRCIQSVISQTYSHQHIECILVDDCSTDNSYSVVKNLLDAYKGEIQFKLLHHAQNKGVAVARNTGLKAATGDYVFLIDNDDQLLPNCLDSLTRAAVKYNDADLVIGNCYNHRSKTYYTNAQEDVVIDDPIEIRRTAYNMTYGAFPWNKLVKHEIIRNHNLYFENVSFDDLHWYIDMLQVIKSMVVLAEETYSYEYIETSLSHTWEKKLDGTAATFLHMIRKAFHYDHTGCYVEHHFFMVFFFMKIYDIIDHYSISSVSRTELNELRGKLIRQAVRDRHFLVALYDTIMYQPVRKLFYWKPVRNRSIPFRLKMAKVINAVNKKVSLS